MNTLNKRFATGFAIGLCLFILINILAVHFASDCGLSTVFGSSCADGITRIGWPLQFYESGGFMYQQNINFLFLLLDLATGLALAVLIGWLFSRNEKAPK